MVSLGKLLNQGLALGDKTIFCPHAVDEVLPDECTNSQSHNPSFPKLYTGYPQLTHRISPSNPQGCPQDFKQVA